MNTTLISDSFKERHNPWKRFCNWITSTQNRIYIGWFGVLMIPTLLTAAICFVLAFVAAPRVDIDGIREPVFGALLAGNNMISAAVIPTSAVELILSLAVCQLWQVHLRWLIDRSRLVYTSLAILSRLIVPTCLRQDRISSILNNAITHRR